jgi:hypothetical protein
MCRVETWILHCVPRVEKDCGTLVYSIPCECSRRYIGKIGRLLAVRLGEPTQNLKEGRL